MSRSLPNPSKANLMMASSLSSRSGKTSASLPMFPDAERDNLVNFLNSKSVSSSSSSRRSNDSLLETSSGLSIQYNRSDSAMSNSRRRPPEHIETFRPTPSHSDSFTSKNDTSHTEQRPMPSTSPLLQYPPECSSSVRSSRANKNGGSISASGYSSDKVSSANSSINYEAKEVEHSTRSSGTTSAYSHGSKSQGASASPCLLNLPSGSSSVPSHGYNVPKEDSISKSQGVDRYTSSLASSGEGSSHPSFESTSTQNLQVMSSKSSSAHTHSYRVPDASISVPTHVSGVNRVPPSVTSINHQKYGNQTIRTDHQVLPSKSSSTHTRSYRVPDASSSVPTHVSGVSRVPPSATSIDHHKYDNQTIGNDNQVLLSKSSAHSHSSRVPDASSSFPTHVSEVNKVTPSATSIDHHKYDNQTIGTENCATRHMARNIEYSHSHHRQIRTHENGERLDQVFEDREKSQAPPMNNKGRCKQQNVDVQSNRLRYTQGDSRTLQDTTNTDSVSLNCYEDNSTIPTNDTFDSTLTTKPGQFHERCSNDYLSIPSAVHCHDVTSVKTHPMRSESRPCIDYAHPVHSPDCGTVPDELLVHREDLFFHRNMPNGGTQFVPYMNSEGLSKNFERFTKTFDRCKSSLDKRDEQANFRSECLAAMDNGNTTGACGGHFYQKQPRQAHQPPEQRKEMHQIPIDHSRSSEVYSIISDSHLQHRSSSSDTSPTAPCSVSVSESVFRVRKKKLEPDAAPHLGNMPLKYLSHQLSDINNPACKGLDNRAINATQVDSFSTMGDEDGSDKYKTTGDNCLPRNGDQSKDEIELSSHGIYSRNDKDYGSSSNVPGPKCPTDASTPVHCNKNQLYDYDEKDRTSILKEIRGVLAMRQKAKAVGDNEEVILLTRHLNLLNDELKRLDTSDLESSDKAEDERSGKDDRSSADKPNLRRDSPSERRDMPRVEEKQRKINIRAPVSLKAGYEFSASIGGKLVKAIVPNDVEKGEIFSVNIPMEPKTSIEAKPPKSILKRKIKVRAPADLNEGYEFTTKVKGKVVKSTIPKGGVKKGEIISVPYIPDSS